MGCWGMGIMQSDSAIDAEIEILETAGLNWDTKSFSKVKSAFSNKFKAIEVFKKFINNKFSAIQLC